MKCAAAWDDRQIVQEVLAQITWYHCLMRHPDEALKCESLLRCFYTGCETVQQVAAQFPLVESLPTIEEIEQELNGTGEMHES